MISDDMTCLKCSDIPCGCHAHPLYEDGQLVLRAQFDDGDAVTTLVGGGKGKRFH